MIDQKLRTLLVLEKERNFSRAAEILEITQPAVTQQINRLEEEHNIKIFTRVGRQLKLTKEGEVLVSTARKLEALEGALTKELYTEKTGHRRLDIGITLTAGNYFIPAILEVFKAKYPLTRFNFHTDIATNIYERLKYRELDFAIIDGIPPTGEFMTHLLANDELIVIAPRGHALARQKKVTLDDLKKEKFILRHETANTREIFEDYLQERFDSITNFDVILEIDNTALIKQLIIAGHGLSVMSRAICAVNLSIGTIAEIKVENFSLKRGIYLIYRKELSHEPIIQSILALSE
ncbi:MAG TPA: LysR family transcriptional regulator [Bacilli bacterium]|nr:LysR family transcriptional regulator [Bacilli bacterium]